MLSLQFFQTKPSPHDGVVKPLGENYNIEMKNRFSAISAYLLDNKLRTLSKAGLLSESSFMFPDSISIKTSLGT